MLITFLQKYSYSNKNKQKVISMHNTLKHTGLGYSNNTLSYSLPLTEKEDI